MTQTVSTATSYLGGCVARLNHVTRLERFIEEVRGDDPELASYLRVEERELEAGGLN